MFANPVFITPGSIIMMIIILIMMIIAAERPQGASSNIIRI